MSHDVHPVAAGFILRGATFATLSSPLQPSTIGRYCGRQIAGYRSFRPSSAGTGLLCTIGAIVKNVEQLQLEGTPPGTAVLEKVSLPR